MNAIAINPSLLTVSPSLLCQLLLAAMEGIATMPDNSEINLGDHFIANLRLCVEKNPDPQVKTWALNELKRTQP